MAMTPDGLAELEGKRVWGVWDFHDGSRLIKRFYAIPGEGGPSTRKMAEWSLVHQLASDSAGFQRRRQGLACQLTAEEAVQYKAALEAECVEVFPL